MRSLRKLLSEKLPASVQLIPVCCGTAYRNKGVQKLLDAVIEFMPSPLDIPAIKGADLETATRLSVIPLMMSRSQLWHSRS